MLVDGGRRPAPAGSAPTSSKHQTAQSISRNRPVPSPTSTTWARSWRRAVAAACSDATRRDRAHRRAGPVFRERRHRDRGRICAGVRRDPGPPTVEVLAHGPQAGTVTPLVTNLPGYPDNMSTGADGRIWVAMVSPINAAAEWLAPRPPILRKAAVASCRTGCHPRSSRRCGRWRSTPTRGEAVAGLHGQHPSSASSPAWSRPTGDCGWAASGHRPSRTRNSATSGRSNSSYDEFGFRAVADVTYRLGLGPRPSDVPDHRLVEVVEGPDGWRRDAPSTWAAAPAATPYISPGTDGKRPASRCPDTQSRWPGGRRRRSALRSGSFRVT